MTEKINKDIDNLVSALAKKDDEVQNILNKAHNVRNNSININDNNYNRMMSNNTRIRGEIENLRRKIDELIQKFAEKMDVCNGHLNNMDSYLDQTIVIINNQRIGTLQETIRNQLKDEDMIELREPYLTVFSQNYNGQNYNGGISKRRRIKKKRTTSRK